MVVQEITRQETNTHNCVETVQLSDIQFLYSEIEKYRNICHEKEQEIKELTKNFEDMKEYAELTSAVANELRNILSDEKYSKDRYEQKRFNREGEEWFNKFTEKHVEWYEKFNHLKHVKFNEVF